jgi:hypothetical protein
MKKKLLRFTSANDVGSGIPMLRSDTVAAAARALGAAVALFRREHVTHD